MKTTVKTVITLLSIAVVLLSASKCSAKNPTVSALGKTITLTQAQINYLHTYNDAKINAAISTQVVIKYNTTADIIISLLSRNDAPKAGANLIAKN